MKTEDTVWIEVEKHIVDKKGNEFHEKADCLNFAGTATFRTLAKAREFGLTHCRSA